MNPARPHPGPIDVVLAVRNGGCYLGEFLESLDAQTFRDWRLIVRDNGSDDDTPGILQRWGARHPGTYLKVVDDQRVYPRASGNFNAALAFASAPYVMLADADDVWCPHKIESTLACMRRAEARVGAHRPLLVHTDLEVVDCRGARIAPSFWSYSHCRPTAQRCRFQRLAVRNVITGCTVMLNRPLLELGWPVPPEAEWHDWWFGLVAAAFGAIVDDPLASVRYRQHGGNETGAKPWSPMYVYRRLRGGTSELRATVDRAQRQAAAFAHRFASRLPERERNWLEAFLSLANYGPLRRRWRALRCPVVSVGLARTLGWYLLI